MKSLDLLWSKDFLFLDLLVGNVVYGEVDLFDGVVEDRIAYRGRKGRAARLVVPNVKLGIRLLGEDREYRISPDEVRERLAKTYRIEVELRDQPKLSWHSLRAVWHLILLAGIVVTLLSALLLLPLTALSSEVYVDSLEGVVGLELLVLVLALFPSLRSFRRR